jgi:hypothetical protein
MEFLAIIVLGLVNFYMARHWARRQVAKGGF